MTDTVFMFSGQGPRYYPMGTVPYASNRTFPRLDGAPAGSGVHIDCEAQAHRAANRS